MIEQSAVEIADAVRRGERSAVEIVDVAFAAIEASNGELNAWVCTDRDRASREAEAIDDQVSRGEDPGRFAGVPFGVKDLEDCAGFPTGHGSLLYAGRPPVDRDSIHVGRLRAAGAIPISKTTTPEFGSLNLTRNKVTGVTRNPWDPDRTPGGSSGGSAAAVAAGQVPMATASDGGGSIRIPAAFSGLVGMKSSHGRIPHPGVSVSQTSVLGILATSVRDAARHLDVVSGPDDRDRLSLPSPNIGYEEAIETLDVSGLRIAWSTDLGYAVVDPEVERLCRDAAAALAGALDADLAERTPRLTDPVDVWLSSDEGNSWLDLEPGMWPGVAGDVTRYVRQCLEASEGLTMPRFAEIVVRRQQLQNEMAAMFDDVDVWLTPTTAVPAFDAERPPSVIAGREVPVAMSTPFTMLSNLTWGPACSVPAGLTSDGLPVGLQIMGRRHADEVVLRLARVFEQVRPWPRLAPSLNSAAG